MLNLGMVELGSQIDFPEPIDDYIFKFAGKDSFTQELRGYAHMVEIFSSLDEELPEVRVFVNYHNEVTLAVCIKLLWMFAHKMSHCYLLFDNGQGVQFS